MSYIIVTDFLVSPILIKLGNNFRYNTKQLIYGRNMVTIQNKDTLSSMETRYCIRD